MVGADVPSTAMQPLIRYNVWIASRDNDPSCSMVARAESERQILGQNVRRLRLKRAWSQEQLAAAAGEMRQATVSEIETADANPEWATIERIAAALGTTIRDLLKPARRRPAK